MGWQDDEIGVFFPPVLAGNRILFRQTYGDTGLGYSLRYGSYNPDVINPHFDLYVYDHGQYIPHDESGVLRIHVAEMVNAMVVVPGCRFSDELAGNIFEKTRIHYLSAHGSYREQDSGVLFGTAIILFPFQGHFIKIRYSEPWCEKTPDTFEEVFERIEENLLENRPNMFGRVGDFLKSLDGLLFGSLGPERRRVLQAARMLGVPVDANREDVEFVHANLVNVATANGALTDVLKKRLDSARDALIARPTGTDAGSMDEQV